MTLLHVFLLLHLFLVSLINSDKVPSTADIDDYNDPVLREVFASSRQTAANKLSTVLPAQLHQELPKNMQPAKENFSKPERASQQTQQQLKQPAYLSSYTNPAESPQSFGYSSPTSDLSSLTAQSAQAFVNGAQQVGRVFGIDSTNYGGSAGYEFPLNGGFFGK